MQSLIGLTIKEWLESYQNQAFTPANALPTLLDSYDPHDPAWITLVSPAHLADQIADLEHRFSESGQDFSQFPLYGIPFAIKDNIDVEQFPTTAACADFAYDAETDATVVKLLKQAGAIAMGKTNLDQFATGLVGTRSPYGEVPNSFKPEYVSGGSSSGSASVVARGLVPFSLGTDTAGSGRVPAGFNNIVGLKPTRGAFSSTGLVPACRSLDCISVFALNVEDAETVFRLAAQSDAQDSYSRPFNVSAPRQLPDKPVFGIPATINWFGDDLAKAAFENTLTQLKTLDVTFKALDFSPLAELASLLYEGPWVAERMAAVEALYKSKPDAINPVVRQIIAKAEGVTATDAFKGEYKRKALVRAAENIIARVDALCVPTTPTIYTRAQIAEDPIVRNSHFGSFTNFVNFADWCALALPGDMRADGLPAGITLIAPTWHDLALAHFGQRWQQQKAWSRGALGTDLPVHAASPVCPKGWIRIAVVGAHLSGMPLNSQLTERNAYWVETTSTSAEYRFYALANTTPPKPGLQRVSDDSGAHIEVELWDMPLTAFGSFVSLIPSPLGIGSLTLLDGRQVHGFMCEAFALDDATDITASGGWRNYLSNL